MSENKSPFVNLVLSITSTCCNKRQELSGNFNIAGSQRVGRVGESDPSGSSSNQQRVGREGSEIKQDKVELEKSESIDQIIETEEP